MEVWPALDYLPVTNHEFDEYTDYYWYYGNGPMIAFSIIEDGDHHKRTHSCCYLKGQNNDWFTVASNDNNRETLPALTMAVMFSTM